MEMEQFQEVVWAYYHDHGRDLPWREPATNGSFDPYRIMVSEIMLQQTQAARVVPKYYQFLKEFPTVADLAEAPLSAVLKTWSGLGYNRRAKFLWQAAGIIAGSSDGFPADSVELAKLPGIGPNTAAAVLVYAFNQPLIFVETNIRTVFIHHFFTDRTGISDKELIPFIKDTLDTENPREWYWALMDYGVFLKSTVGNVTRDSRHYTKQSAFHGSRRQLRGEIIRRLTTRTYTAHQLSQELSDNRLDAVLDDLVQESLIRRVRNIYTL